MSKTIRGDKKARKAFRRENRKLALRKLAREFRCSEEEMEALFDDFDETDQNHFQTKIPGLDYSW